MSWTKLVRAGVLMAVGLVLPLLPWAARNWRTLHEVQFLTPRYLQMPDDFSPRRVQRVDGHVAVAVQ